MIGKLVNRHEKIAYYGVLTDGTVTYHRMRGFTKMNTEKNPVEYARRYIDESFEQTDVVAFSPSIAFSFDRHSGNPVHDDIVNLSETEALGADAVRSIVVVDMSTEENGVCAAVCRNFSVVVDTEGDSKEAYTLSGTFRTKGDKVFGTASVSEDGETLEFTADA